MAHRSKLSKCDYFHSCPSACDYSGIKSAGSNLGPTSKKLYENLEENVRAYRKLNGVGVHTPIPADAITSSGSGLDPHSSIENANLKCCCHSKPPFSNSPPFDDQYTEKKTLGIFGRERVNVLMLNLAIQQASKENSKRK